jgi:hypothetical protein
MEIQTVTYVKMRLFDGTALRKSGRERLQLTVDKFSDYSSGEISRLGYIRCLGYKFSAVTDILGKYVYSARNVGKGSAKPRLFLRF